VHEYSIVAALVERVGEIARERDASSVRRLVVSIGEVSGVEVELLRTAYETFRERTVCEGASLTIRSVPAEWACSLCGASVARGERLVCAACGGACRLVAGEEIVLERVELEVA
jgi:hydrogenase nickel incorporation protein HypA/HybF